MMSPNKIILSIKPRKVSMYYIPIPQSVLPLNSKPIVGCRIYQGLTAVRLSGWQIGGAVGGTDTVSCPSANTSASPGSIDNG